MNLLIGRIAILYILCMGWSIWIHAQSLADVRIYPAQHQILEEGYSKIDEEVHKQKAAYDSINVLLVAMNWETAEMNSWEHKYNSYLKNARGYAEKLKASISVYIEGVQILQRLLEVKRAVEANPQGILATFSMSNVYVETTAQLIETYNLLKSAIAKKNMLTGAERTELFWMIQEQLAGLNNKFHEMAISIAYYNMMDVWKRATAGMVSCNKKKICEDAMRNWKRAQETYNVIYGK